ncbi:hypothetical protein [Nonomuraea sediminis]|uniref:hypothetical protein n=1 Tax=Nonomuraea sediminis TaxID=2835864 RepID=UPI001BDCB013|nr:hypothetical protein [Nonomuraea sediminis]
MSAIHLKGQALLTSLTDLVALIGPWLQDSPTIDLIDDAGNTTAAPPLPLYPEPGGVYRWGSTDNGDYLLWFTDPEHGYR